MKTTVKTIGILGVLVIFVIWQYGFLQGMWDESMKRFERATAVSRAERMIEETRKNADALEERARQMKIEAQAMDLGIQRTQEASEKSLAAIKGLSRAIKEAGLPKPGESQKLTAEQKQVRVVLGSKEGTADEAYRTLTKWTTDYCRKKKVLDARQKLVEARREVAEKIIASQSEMYEKVELIKTRLAELETGREIAAIHAELSKLGANAEGVNVGNLGKVLDTLQEEIDELNATAMVIQGETQVAQETPFSQEDVFPMANEETAFLETIWEEL
ncbi:MAG: hypothetical protein Q4D62_04595 [Planctomycetia bacterium]|nr:hypothetical protein [Planctomycetia bacterium]